MAVQLRGLTLQVQSAVDHWNSISRQGSLQGLDNRLTQLSPPSTDQDSSEPPHVATLIWQRFSSDPLTIHHVLLNSLPFHMMEYRHEEIHEAHPNTYDWAFTNLFQSWLTSSEPVFWISGKPGSGKSTLMKFLVNNRQTSNMLRKWAGDKTLAISSYFFWINGTPLQRSREGLLRSLLYDILRRRPELVKDVLPEQYAALLDRSANRKPLGVDWTRKALLDALGRLSSMTDAIDTSFCMFIDGLDEYRADSSNSFDDLVETINYLIRLNIKICVASRPWNEFEDAYGRNPDCKLYLQELNKPDIRLYVSDHLESRPEFKALQVKNNTEVADILEEISEKSQGVFLWVCLVVQSLVDGLRNQDRISQLRTRLHHFPSDLEDFFRHIFTTLEPLYCMQTAHMFQVALAASAPLSPVAYWYMDEEEEVPGLAVSMKIQDIPDDQLNVIVTQTNARLNGRCRGLLEITPPVRDIRRIYHVDFLHRTVKDFFMTNEIHEIFATDQQKDFNPNLAICRAVLAEIKSIAMSQVNRVPLDELMTCFFHAAQFLEKETHEVPIDLLQELKRTIEVYSSIGSTYLRTASVGTSFMKHVINYDLLLYAKEDMTSASRTQKKDILKSMWRMTPSPLTMEMFLIILSNGLSIAFDLALQNALAAQLKTLNKKDFSTVMNAVLEYASFTDFTKDRDSPLPSPQLWKLLKENLSKKDLDRVLRPAPRTVQQKQDPVQRSSRNPFRVFRR